MAELEELQTSPEQDPAPVDFESRFAPFVRRDVYGRYGRGELPWTEKVLIAFALVTLVPVRIAVAASMFLFYYLLCWACTLFQTPNRDGTEQEDYAHMHGWRRTVIVATGKFLSRIFLFVLGFYRIKEIYLPPEKIEKLSNQYKRKKLPDGHGRPGGIISNHVSYIDIVYHMYSSFPSFVAKRSVAELPFIGLLSKCVGCVYVKRGSRTSQLKGVSGIVSKRIQEAQNNKDVPQLMLFPEGTTTNGEFLLPFKTGAFLPKAPLLPVILKYPYERFSLAYESINGVCHAMFLLCQFVNHMEVIHLPVYYPSQEEMEDHSLYANNVRALMAAAGNLKLTDIGVREKWAYLSAVRGNNTLPSDSPWKED